MFIWLRGRHLNTPLSPELFEALTSICLHLFFWHLWLQNWQSSHVDKVCMNWAYPLFFLVYIHRYVEEVGESSENSLLSDPQLIYSPMVSEGTKINFFFNWGQKLVLKVRSFWITLERMILQISSQALWYSLLFDINWRMLLNTSSE